MVDPGDVRGEGGRVRPPHLEADIEAVPVGLAAGGLGLGLRMRVLWRGEEGEREREGRQGEAGRPGADRRRPRKRPVRCGHAGFLRGAGPAGQPSIPFLVSVQAPFP